jgi:hypothetical protein
MYSNNLVLVAEWLTHPIDFLYRHLSKVDGCNRFTFCRWLAG